MTVTKDDVKEAIESLEINSVEKGEGSADLNSSNGAADDKESLGVDAENMNDKHGNKKGKGYAKSEAPSDFGAGLPGEIETKVDVSSFLKSLVDHSAHSHDQLRDFVVKSDMANDARFSDVNEAIADISKSQANIGIVLKAICERIGVMENQPGVAKSQTAAVIAKSEPVERTFAGANPDQPAEPEGRIAKALHGKPANVAKSMVSDQLCELVRKGEASDLDVINFETYNHISPELETKLAKAFA
jgi:hypothetical protein